MKKLIFILGVILFTACGSNNSTVNDSTTVDSTDSIIIDSDVSTTTDSVNINVPCV